jgi:hypothetical protein
VANGEEAVDWSELRRHADRQLDLVTRQQCLSAGMSPHALSWRVESRRWVRVHDGVYLTKPGRDDWPSRAAAALLFAAPDGVAANAALAGRSAAHLWGLDPRQPEEVELVVPERRRVRAPQGIVPRRVFRFSRVLDAAVFPWRTTPSATVLDVASEGTPLDALSIAARAVQKQLVTPAALRRELDERGGHRYSRLLRTALADVAHGAESGVEVLYIRDVERAHGLPEAVRQSPDGWGRLDNDYEEFGVVVEVDGRLGHELWSDRVKDGQRDRRLLTRSRITTHVFVSDIVLTPCRTAAEVGLILRHRGWGGSPRRCRRSRCGIPR